MTLRCFSLPKTAWSQLKPPAVALALLVVRLCPSYVWKSHSLNLLCGCPSFLPLQDQERLVFSNKRVAAANNIDMQGLKVCLPPGLGNREGR